MFATLSYAKVFYCNSLTRCLDSNRYDGALKEYDKTCIGLIKYLGVTALNNILNNLMKNKGK